MTGKCTDRRLGDRLYAWEVGLLEGDAREAFETHLLECAFCQNRARVFKEEARLIRHDYEVRKSVANLVHETVPRHWFRSRIGRTAVVMAAVIALLLLRPWQLEFHPTNEAQAVENRLLIAPFENFGNPGDSTHIGEMIANLMIADLAGCPSLRVVSDQRSRDIQKLLGRSTGGAMPGDLALEVARRTHSRWLLTGKVRGADSTMTVAVQLVEVSTGDLEAAFNISDVTGQSIFSLVDSLTVLVRGSLSLPRSDDKCLDLPVADVTTSSSDAYRAYLEGVDLVSRYYTREAVESFQKAVALDSTFAMAYYYLARLSDRAYLEKAVRFSDHATHKERLYIQSLAATDRDDIGLAVASLDSIVQDDPDEKQAWYELGRHAYSQLQYLDAVRYCHRAVELDPQYKLPYNILTYVYQKLERPDSALWAIDKYIEIVPNEPNPYDTRGDLYTETGRLKEAAASYEIAVGIKRDFAGYATLQKLAEMHALSGDYPQARSLLMEIAQCDRKTSRSRARTGLAEILLYQGKLDSGMAVLNDGIAADRLEQATSLSAGDRAYKHYLKACVYSERGRSDSAVAQVALAVEVHNLVLPDDRYGYRYFLAQALADAGRLDSARAVTEEMRRYLEEKGIDLSGYRYALGCIALAEGKTAEAITAFTAVDAARDAFYNEFMLATTYLKAGRAADAAGILGRQINNYGFYRRALPIWSAECHYYLAVALEETGHLDDAIKEYRTFLDLWKQADSALVVVTDAQARLTRLVHTP
jgi:tetratricopeptide (TPR) repeat protein/TolB-like protein